jgi:hypothetical protein
LACAVIALTQPCAAQEQALDLRYEADAVCPDLPAFSAILREKLGAAGIDALSAVSPRLQVGLRAIDSGFAGQLQLRRADGTQYDREVRGASCAEVANALAFVLALALGVDDPAAVAAEPPNSTPEPPPPAAPVSPPKKITPAPAAAPRPHEPPRHPLRSLWAFGGGVELGARAGLAPSWALVESAFLEARRASSSPFGLSFRAGFENMPTVSLSTVHGTTAFSWRAARLEACPVRLRLFPPLELEPCAGVHLGQVRGSGQPVGNGTARSQSKPWFDGLAALRRELSVTRGLTLHVAGQVLLPFTRYLFAFDGPSTTVYQVPGVASAGFVGLAGHFR